MAEWLKATVLKTVMGRPIVSSNLTASSRKIEMSSLNADGKVCRIASLCYYGDMTEQFKSKRAKFKKGKQKEFIIKSKEELGLTWQEFSQIAKTSSRNLNDWKNEKISMSVNALSIICKKRKCALPKEIEILNPYWYARRGALLGGKATYEKYGIIGGNQEKRKEKWNQWWEKEGKLKPNEILKPLPFKKPRFSKKLAEFVGIMLGDGGMTKNQVKVTLHSVDDLEYSRFIENLMRDLFDVKPGRTKRNDCKALEVVLSRVGLVKFLVDNVGLCTGNKIRQQVDIPDWVKNDDVFKLTCLRGLIDTDGCVIIHKYKVNGKCYLYKKLSFTSRSIPLLNSAKRIFDEVDIKSRITKNNLEIRVEAKRDIERYFSVIGTHNPKHLMRYEK